MKKNQSERDNVTAESIPKTLVDRNQWICWRYAGDRKPPYDAKTGQQRNPLNPDTWSDFETTVDAYRREDYDGIGFVLSADDPFAGFDFDKIRTPSTGEINEEIESIIERLSSYTEVSPSGTGTHTLIQGEIPSDYTNTESIEVYDSKRYFTVTGNHLEWTRESIKKRQEELEVICDQHLTKKSTKAERDHAELPAENWDEETIEEAREYIHDFLYGQDTGPRAREYYADLLKGRYAERGFKNDRSNAETTLCSLLYGIFIDGGAEPERARDLTYHYLTYAVTENPYTKRSGERRKWVARNADRQRAYRQNTLDYAIENFEFEIWDLWRQSGNRKTNDYCEHAYEVAMDALYNLTVEYVLSSNPPHLSTNMTPESQDSGGGSSRENPYPTMGEIVERAQEEYGLAEESFENILRNIRQEGGAKMARIGSSTYVYYPATYPNPADACYVRVEGEKHDPISTDESPEKDEKEVRTDGGMDISNSEYCEVSEQIQGVFECPLDRCSKVFEEDRLRSHVNQTDDDIHRGLILDDALSPVEKHKLEHELREQYVKQGRTQQEIADEWGVGRNTIHRWLKKHSIDRRDWTGTRAWNRVQYASFYTETHENGGYEKVGSYDPELEGMRWTTVHQLTAIADGTDPNKVFSNGEYQTHHRTPIPWLNFAENVEVIPREQHQHAHQRGEWDEKDGLPVLVSGQPLTDEEYHAMWGPGVRNGANEDQEPESHEKKPASNNTNHWGPGAPTTDV